MSQYFTYNGYVKHKSNNYLILVRPLDNGRKYQLYTPHGSIKLGYTINGDKLSNHNYHNRNKYIINQIKSK